MRRTPRQCPTRGWAQPEKLISALPACQRGCSRRLRWVNPARTVAERPPMWTRLLASPLHQDSAATTGRSLEECATTSGRPPEKGRPSRNLAGEPASNPRLSAPLHYPGRPRPLWMNKASNVSVGWSTAAANPRWVSSMGPSPFSFRGEIIR